MRVPSALYPCDSDWPTLRPQRQNRENLPQKRGEPQKPTGSAELPDALEKAYIDSQMLLLAREATKRALEGLAETGPR